MGDNEKQSMPKAHITDEIAQKVEQAADKFQKQTNFPKTKSASQNDPPGGFDQTAVPRAPVGFTVKFIFHRAENLPAADINSLSSDPFLTATLKTRLPTRHKQDPDLQWRTPTIRKCVNPVWNDEWIVANVPASGFNLKLRIYDEDPADHDDRLGNVHIDVDGISEGWAGIKEQKYDIKKRAGSKRAYFIRGCVAMLNRSVKMDGDVFVSIEVLGRTDAQHGGRLWTIGPCGWSKHYSPMIGRLAGTKAPGEHGKPEKYNFQANQMQLEGPVPEELYHRYVEFKPFVRGMFTSTSFRGRLLNHALHHQHARIYNYDRSTVYGSFPSPSRDMTLQFLDFVHYGQGGRIFTYVLTLDGKWRFTETGKEFGIDLLSKHTMHSDVNIYIAFSGEFFVRKLKQKPEDNNIEEALQSPHPGPSKDDDSESPKDPSCYSLIIDNDSGTYRPSAKLLSQLRMFMEHNLPGLKVITLDCNGDKDKMNTLKDEQRERKKKEGPGQVGVQDRHGSISSSDISDIDAQERLASGKAKLTKVEKMERKMHLKKAQTEQTEGSATQQNHVQGSAVQQNHVDGKPAENKDEKRDGVLDKVEEPAKKIEADHEGKKEREARETEDDTAANTANN